MTSRQFQAPKGTRDFYPADLLRRRYLEKLWRDTSIRHGFEEIDGPAFEHLDLYTVKSGEGIVSEIFGVFSGKDEQELSALRAGGSAPFALRPEFTPTLARMYAAKAGSLPKPTRWFWQQGCFRAERPQRGRLREFMQWNADLIGDGSPEGDCDAIACCVDLLSACGLTPADVRVRFNHRAVLAELMKRLGVDDEHMPSAFVLLDRRDRLKPDDLEAMAYEFGLTDGDFVGFLRRPADASGPEAALEWIPAEVRPDARRILAPLDNLRDLAQRAGLGEFLETDLNVARGLAYYTGMVFEVHEANGAERAVAGGGRYDGLIETFGGPSTPAVGFGMGDVVLALVLEDRKLMPEGAALLDALSRPSASYRPEVFVIPAGPTPADQDATAALVRPLLARLRRGTESPAWLGREGRTPWDADRYDADAGGARPMHARASGKTTRNIGKLVQDAVAQRARLAVILESAEECAIKNLDTNEQDAHRTKLEHLPRVLAKRLGG